MTWTFLPDDFITSPEVLAAGPDAAMLHVAGLVYSARHLLDGRIPTVALPAIAFGRSPAQAHRLANQLVDVGLWRRTPEGWEIVAHLAMQDSKARVEARRAAKAAAGRVGGQRSGEARRQASLISAVELRRRRQEAEAANDFAAQLDRAKRP